MDNPVRIYLYRHRDVHLCETGSDQRSPEQVGVSHGKLPETFGSRELGAKVGGKHLDRIRYSGKVGGVSTGGSICWEFRCGNV